MRSFLILALFAAGCAYPYPHDRRYPGEGPKGLPEGPGGTVRIIEDGFVESLHVDQGLDVNIQINSSDVPDGKALFERELTIGKFSKIFGSGFTRKKNIYYRKRIYTHGSDSFQVNGKMYTVYWKRDEMSLLGLKDAYYLTIIGAVPN